MNSEPLLILRGDCITLLKDMPPESVQCCVTSPPYWGLRNYGNEPGQIGLELTPDAYVQKLVDVFREVYRVLKPDGTLWLNLGDTYKDKRLLGMPWRVALAMQEDEAVCLFCGEREWLSEWREADAPDEGLHLCPWCHQASIPTIERGWMLRQEIIWHKPNAMPEAVKDRCARDHEHLFLFAKRPGYLYRQMREPVRSDRAPSRKAKATGAGKAGQGRGGSAYTGEGDTRVKRTVWSVPVSQCKAAHFAIFPAQLIRPCILASTNPGDTVLDPFGGSGTTGLTALQEGRRAVMCELNPDYIEIAKERTSITPSLPLS